MKMMLKKTKKVDQDIEKYDESEYCRDGESVEDFAEEEVYEPCETDDAVVGEAGYYEIAEEYEGDEEYCEAGEEYGGGEAYCEAAEEYGGGEEYCEAGEEYGGGEAYCEAGEEYGSGEAYCEAGEEYDGGEAYYEAGEEYGDGEAHYEAAEEYDGGEEYCEAAEEYDGGEAYYEAAEEYDGGEAYCEAREEYGSDEEYYEGDYEGGVYDTEEADDSYYIAEEAADGYYGEDEPDYNSEITYEEAPWELEQTASGKRIPERRNGAEAGFFANLGRHIRSMDIMDRIMLVTGVFVIILAIVTGSVFVSIRSSKQQVSDFANVGRQLEGIRLIGEYGLLAVADAEAARLAAASVVSDEEQKPGYQENGYDTQVTVEMNFTSIQKDLKIKFVNKRTGKLVPNVPFAVTVTAPDGSTSIWSDDDMDGIIYKTDIASGTYKVAMEELTGSRYADYTISTDVHSTTVEKEIVYKKVDVENEVKQENEVNAAQEDTKVKGTTESILEDTVMWVESKAISASYDEVLKGNGNHDIPDPFSLMSLQALNKRFWRMVEEDENNTSEDTEPSTETQTPAPTETPSTEPAQEPTDTETPPSEPTESETPVSTGEPAITESPSPSPSLSPSPSPVTVKVTVKPETLSGPVGSSIIAQAIVEATVDGKAAENFQYNITASSNDENVASVTVDSTGKISVKGIKEGKATITVKVEQAVEDGSAVNSEPATATIEVTITKPRTMTLNSTSMTVITVLTAQDVSGSLVAAVTGVDNPEVTAVSSDPSVATVNYKGNVVNILGVKAGSAVITVTYIEGDAAPVTATCTVTVKTHPRNDTITRLQTKDGQQVYVQDGNTYREAVWADYYVEGRNFYVRKDVKYTGWQTLDGKVYFYTADGIKVTGEQVIQGAKYTFASDGSLLVGSNGTVGIDVSKWNGTIDWNAVKNSGISYVIIRCGYRGSSEGKLIEDEKFQANIKGASAAGLKIGIYFFSQAVNEVEAVEEASMVLGLIKGYTISYPIFLDVEASGGRGDKIDKSTRTAVCNAFCQTIKNEGYTAGVYSNKTWLESRIDANSLGAYKIWLAQYAERPTYTGRYELWQYRASGRVNGISGSVDMNISYLGY